MAPIIKVRGPFGSWDELIKKVKLVVMIGARAWLLHKHLIYLNPFLETFHPQIKKKEKKKSM